MGNNVFVGAGAIILLKVTVGTNVIIGAGSVVTKDVAENMSVIRVPAKKSIKKFDIIKETSSIRYFLEFD